MEKMNEKLDTIKMEDLSLGNIKIGVILFSRMGRSVIQSGMWGTQYTPAMSQRSDMWTRYVMVYRTILFATFCVWGRMGP